MAHRNVLESVLSMKYEFKSYTNTTNTAAAAVVVNSGSSNK